MNRRSRSRRGFLQAVGQGAVALSPLGQMLAGAGVAMANAPVVSGYGSLKAVRDQSTGLPLLRLPPGFSYTTFGWAKERLEGGVTCPGAHDGMGVVRAEGDRITLIRNHEIWTPAGAFGPSASHYDAECSGGTVTLEFDTAQGKLISARPSLSGTMNNCAGGATPWGTWLSCEEFVCKAGVPFFDKDGPDRTLGKDHGFIFEVPAEGHSDAVPLTAMGQFRHEAAAVHEASGDLYLTEDAEPSAGFYRFVPKRPGVLREGGQLYMLKAEGRNDLRSGLKRSDKFSVTWVPIEHPDRGYEESANSTLGVLRQGLVAGGSRFTRLEGCVAKGDEVYFTATNGGDTANGQVFCYRPSKSELELVFESNDAAVLDYPDNVTLSPRGGLLICQDSKLGRQHLFCLTRDGEIFPFARQNVMLDGAKGFVGDFRGAEWAGCCFSPDGKWLFANVYKPGFTVAITGPWKEGWL